MTHPAAQRARELAAAPLPPVHGDWIAEVRTLLPELVEAYEALEVRADSLMDEVDELVRSRFNARNERDRVVALNTRLLNALRTLLDGDCQVPALWLEEVRALLAEAENTP